MICFHRFRAGYGLMQDAVMCEKCGYTKYPEALSLWGKFCLMIRGT